MHATTRVPTPVNDYVRRSPEQHTLPRAPAQLFAAPTNRLRWASVWSIKETFVSTTEHVYVHIGASLTPGRVVPSAIRRPNLGNF